MALLAALTNTPGNPTPIAINPFRTALPFGG